MTLLAPQKSNISVTHLVTSAEEDPAVWAMQNKSLLAIRSVKGAIAAYVGEERDSAARRERSGRYSELYEVMTYFSQRSRGAKEGGHTPTPSYHKNYSMLLRKILVESGICGAPSRDVIAHFSAYTGLVNGTLTGTMKKALSEIQSRSDSFIQSDSAVVRMLSLREVPSRVLQYMRDTRFSILETDLLLHFLDHPNTLVSQSEIRVLSSKDPNTLSSLDDAIEQLEAFLHKIADGPFVIVREDGEHFSETAWRLQIESEVHRKLATNTISSEELRPWSVAAAPLQQLEMPSFSELAKMQIKEKKLVPTIPIDKDVLQNRSQEFASGNSTEAVPAPTARMALKRGITPKSAKRKVAQSIPAIPFEEEKTNEPQSEVVLPAVISEHIVLRAEELGRLCKTELATDMVCSRFEQLAREKASRVPHYHRRRIVDRLAGEFRAKWGHIFSAQEASQIFSESKFQGFVPVSYSAGSPEKIGAFIRRYESGWPLFHPEDESVAYAADDDAAADYEGIDGPPEEYLRSHSRDQSARYRK